ncbi:MAG: hypothetical protein ACXV5I_09495 [Halobacteriota archaeon]
MSSALTCNCGHAPLWCKRFFNDILARADVETDEAEKQELLKFHAWGSRGIIQLEESATRAVGD